MEYLNHRAESLPFIGIGTYRLGEDAQKAAAETRAFKSAIDDFGMTLIDTAELYGYGDSERFVGTIIKDYKREKLFIVDKILPENAKQNRYEACCRQSLARLGVEYIDLYLLHWDTGVDLQNMVNQMQALVEKGLIRHWGVSNFDIHDMKALFRCQNGDKCFCNQILYNLRSRGAEYDLIPWCHAHDVAVMAYSPVGHNAAMRKALVDHPPVVEIARKEQKTPDSLLLSFVIHSRKIITIFKTGDIEHLKENMQNVFAPISQEDMQALSKHFKAPTCAEPLETI